jgi:hypothetical protein
MVYFVQDERGGPIKIGYCGEGQAARRLAQIQTHNPSPLRMTRVIQGDRGVERELHKRFADLRIRGEWFYPATELAVLAEAIDASDMAMQIVAAAEDILTQGAV